MDNTDVGQQYLEWSFYILVIISIITLAVKYYKHYMNNRCDRCHNTKTTNRTITTGMTIPMYIVIVTCTKCKAVKKYYK